VLQDSVSSKQTANSRRSVTRFHGGSEHKLLQDAKAGHAAAFAGLSEQYQQQLLRAAQRITRNHEDSEDAVQDALMNAFIHLRDFDGRSSFGTWLTRIAINSALMILRKRRGLLESAMVSTDDFSENALGYEPADHAPNPEKLYACSEEHGLLKTAISRLRPALREVLEVHQLQDRPMREAAQAMSISVAAAKGRLFHAKAALRRSPVLRLMCKPRVGREFRVLSAA
jgi:RNA polymerase sigma-70 factor, ECF subfamily